jgi:hypothetical protein
MGGSDALEGCDGLLFNCETGPGASLTVDRLYAEFAWVRLLEFSFLEDALRSL